MGYVLFAISLAWSVPVFWLWMKFWAPRVRGPYDLADYTFATGEWIDLVSMLLPAAPRRIWHGLLAGGVWFLMGVPHHLMVWGLTRPGAVRPWYYLHYFWALALWLACLALPALVLTRHRRARAEARAAAPPP